MATPYSNIYDQALMFIQDYRLINLYNQSVVNFEDYLLGWLKPAIVDFQNNGCIQNLTSRDDTLRQFTEDLTDETIVILSRLMVKYWLEKEVKDITQMRLHIQDHDFKTFAEANNFKEKNNILLTVKEDCSQMLNEYSYRHNNWASWLNGSFT